MEALGLVFWSMVNRNDLSYAFFSTFARSDSQASRVLILTQSTQPSQQGWAAGLLCSWSQQGTTSSHSWVQEPGSRKKTSTKRKELFTSASRLRCQTSSQFVAVHIHTKTDKINQTKPTVRGYLGVRKKKLQTDNCKERVLQFWLSSHFTYNTQPHNNFYFPLTICLRTSWISTDITNRYTHTCTHTSFLHDFQVFYPSCWIILL